MSAELTSKTAVELACLIRSGKASSVEVVEAHLKRIEELNSSLNAIVTIAPDALDRARAADEKLIAGLQVGPLHGLPITIKDTIDTKGLRTTYGSRLRAAHIPTHDATVVARLKAAGAIVLGKTNTPEMAIPYETNNPVFGATNNPHDHNLTPGGSSGGEAAAIAALLSPAGIGSDLSGSIRVPAHFCGIAGLKPTVGRVPMDGHQPAAVGALSLGACIGPMARSVIDLGLVFNVIAGEPATGMAVDDAISRGKGALSGARVAWHSDDGVTPVTAETREAVARAAKVLADAGLAVNETHPPAIHHGSRLWIELFARAAQAQLRDFYRGREAEAGPLVSSVLAKASVSESFDDRIAAAEGTAKAVVERERLREDLLRWMKSTPLILAPVAAVPAFTQGTTRVTVNDQSISVFRACSYSQTYNVFGLPAVVVPAGCSASGLPIGVQIAGRPFAEHTILAAAAIVEESLRSESRL